VASAQTALSEAWLHPEGLAVAARAVAQLAPGYGGMIHFREPDGTYSEVGLHAHGKLVTTWDDFPAPNTLPRLQACLAYQFEGSDPYAGKAVHAELTFVDEERRTRYRALLDENGFSDTVRVLLRRGPRMRAWCGVFRPRGDRPVGPDVAARLARIIPAMQDLARAADLTRYGRADAGTLQGLFEAFEQPIWLVTPRGTIACANAVARGLGGAAATAARRAAAVTGDPRFTISRVSIEGDALALVIGRSFAALGTTLPPSLVPVADGIARGATDKQIAAELELPLATVRTYVRRCYDRLGVHNRVELARLWRRLPDAKPR